MKIIITDDHPLVRAGFRQAIESTFREDTVLEASTAAELDALLREDDAVDLILLDYFMPDSDGFEVLDRLTLSLPDTPVIILSACNDPAIMRRAIDLGAAGFIPKDTTNDVLLSALRLVLSGGTYIPPTMLDGQTENGETASGPGTDGPMPSPPRPQETGCPLDQLTHRQREVLRLIAGGLTNKAISQRLGVSENTVKVHITSILKTLGVSNRTQAVICAQQWGLDD